MPGRPVVASIEFAFPFVEQLHRYGGVAGFVGEIVGDAAVSVNIIEMLPQALRQEPCRDGEILVVVARQPLAISVSILQCRRLRGNGIFRRKRGPDLISGTQVLAPSY